MEIVWVFIKRDDFTKNRHSASSEAGLYASWGQDIEFS